MLRDRFFKLLGAFFLLTLFLIPSNVWAGGKTYIINFQMAWHTRHPEYFAIVNPHKGVSKFSKDEGLIPRLEKAAAKLGYKLKFILYPADQLVKRKMALEGLKMGTIDMLASCAAYYHGLVPEGDVDWMPYVTATVGREKAWEFFNSGELAKIKRQAYLKKANAYWVTSVLCGGENVLMKGTNPVKSLSDLKGKKIRAAGGLSTRVVMALGAEPVTMATGEVYPAIQRGVLDGLVFPIYGLRDYKLIDYVKAVTQPELYVWSDELWINKDKFYSLPKKLRKVFVVTAKKWAEWASTEYWPAYQKELIEWAKKKGCHFYKLPKKEQKRWKKAVAPVWEWYANESPGCRKEVELLKAFLKKFER